MKQVALYLNEKELTLVDEAVASYGSATLVWTPDGRDTWLPKEECDE